MVPEDLTGSATRAARWPAPEVPATDLNRGRPERDLPTELNGLTVCGGKCCQQAAAGRPPQVRRPWLRVHHALVSRQAVVRTLGGGSRAPPKFDGCLNFGLAAHVDVAPVGSHRQADVPCSEARPGSGHRGETRLPNLTALTHK